jgi:hypothetical protein
MAKKNKITAITYLRDDSKHLRKYVTKEKQHQIVLTLKSKIPAFGYGKDEIIELLNKF